MTSPSAATATTAATAAGPTRALADFALRVRFDELPEPTRAQAVRTVLNWLGCAIGASRHPTVERALAAVRRVAGPPQAGLMGRPERLDILNAALLNGMSSHTFDFDDTHLRTIIHPAGPVVPALLALAETKPVSGRDFLAALVVGVEVECRVGNAVYPEHYDRGWHITGTAGVFGAAAACGRLMGLSVEQLVWALGIAATQSSGLREMFGSMCKPFHPGNAARNGLLAAMLAREDFTSSDRAIEAPRGFGHVLSTRFDAREITNALGRTWEIDLNTYKPYACGVVIHPCIDGCVELARVHGLKAEDIERIDLAVHPLVLELTGRRTPCTGLEGKFSVYHGCACAVIYGRAGESEYADEIVNAGPVIALRERIHAEPRPGVAEHQCAVKVSLRDGRTLEHFVEHALGSLERPMDDAALDAKFHALADGVVGAGASARLVAACRGMAGAADVAAALVPLATTR